MPKRNDLKWLNVKALQAMCNPLNYVPWPSFKRPISVKEVLQAVAEGRLASHHAREVGDDSRKVHIERTAYLVVNGWEAPIEVDVGIPALGYEPGWMIEDGNHRFLAAIVRGDEHIYASAGGQVSLINKLCKPPRKAA